MTTRPVKAAMTRGRIALVCAVAGLAVFGASVGMDAIGRRLYNRCFPDPYGFSDPCPAHEWIWFGIVVACWLFPTYLLARREAIGPFACAFMGLIVWLGILVSVVLLVAVHTSPSSYDTFDEAWEGVRIGLIMAPVIGLLTAGVGYAMQAIIRARRRKRLALASA